MKKLLVLGAALALGSLTGCAIGGSGGGEAGAIENAKMQTIASVNGQPITEGTKVDVGQDNGIWNNAHLTLTTKQKVLDKKSGKDYDVDITWSIPETSVVKERFTSDETHEEVHFNYSKTEEFDFAFTCELKCGSATGTGSYEIHLLKNNLVYDTKTIQQIYEVDPANKYGYKGIETSGKSEGYYKANEGGVDSFYYVETYGRVVYYAPDGDWALIADGQYYLELFAGKGAANLRPSGFPALEVGKTVKVLGEMTSYFGNAQMSFIKDISSADDSKAAAPADYKALEASTFVGKHYWEDYLANTNYYVTGTYNGNIKVRGTAATSIKNDRFTFEVKLGTGEIIEIAYDYHVDPEDHSVYNAYKAKIESFSVGSAITVKGTLRFVGSEEKSYKNNEDDTTWQLTPYLADHIA